MRKSTDACLLCQANAANKTNSHILPRFISTGFFGAKGAQRRGFAFNGENELSLKPRTVQDSPKENYILCDECETYFSLLETASAPSLKFWQAKVASGKFKMTSIKSYLKVVEMATPDPVIMRLLVYSMFWRATVSSLEIFEGYDIDPSLTESLRCTLLKFKALNNADLQANLGSKKIILHPYSILTAESYRDETANVLAAINPGNPASLNVDKFGFILFKSEADISEQVMADFSNLKITDNQIMVVSEQLWHEVMVKRPLEMVAQQARKNSSKPQ